MLPKPFVGVLLQNLPLNTPFGRFPEHVVTCLPEARRMLDVICMLTEGRTGVHLSRVFPFLHAGTDDFLHPAVFFSCQFGSLDFYACATEISRVALSMVGPELPADSETEIQLIE